MFDTLLTIVQRACDELGLQRPSVVANATDLQARQLFSLINRELRELQQNYNWTALQTEFDLTIAPPLVANASLTQGSPVANLMTPLDGLMPDLFLAFAQGVPVNTRVQDVQQTGIGQPQVVTFSQPSSLTIASTPVTFARDTYSGPPDFDRFLTETWWDRTNRWALLGPDSPQIDQWHRSGIVTVGPRRHFRQVGFVQGDFDNTEVNSDFVGGLNNYRLWPPPAVTDAPFNIAFEYISKYPVYAVPAVGDPTGQQSFQADTDICILDSEMLVLGAKWRMWQIKGFDYSDFQQEYQDYVDRAYANDGGMKTLSMARSLRNGLVALTQDANFPGPSGPNSS